MRDYLDDADLFGVWCPELKTVYLVPVSACGTREAWLRVDATRNNQASGIRMAKDYELT